MAMKTQGTMLYVLVPTVADPAIFEILKVGCPKNINTGGDPAEKIDTTCLDSGAKESISGLPSPPSATVDINADPRDPSHVRLYQLSQDVPGEERPRLKWALGWSDGTDAPTIGTPTDDFTLPKTRTWLTFEGWISDFPFSFATNSAVETSISIERTSAAHWVVKE